MTGSAILESDEYMHEVMDHPQFNESAYYNFVDDGSGFALLIRMGNRVNEGHAEVTVLAYLPGGRACIRFAKPAISHNEAFDAGGLRFEVIEPLQRMRVTFDGDGYLLDRGTDLADPKQAFTTSPVVPMRLSLDYVNVVPAYGLGEGSGIAGAENSIAVGHYQGPCSVSGWVEIDGAREEVDGFGFRDHSWGPRKWHGPFWWRWLSCMVDSDNGFTAWSQKLGDTRSPGHGMYIRDGVSHRIVGVEVETQYGDAPYYPEAIVGRIRTEAGEEIVVTGEVFHNVPLRNRRDGKVARLAEVVVKFAVEGREGYGICEYHDRIEDGVPIGMSEA